MWSVVLLAWSTWVPPSAFNATPLITPLNPSGIPKYLLFLKSFTEPGIQLNLVSWAYNHSYLGG